MNRRSRITVAVVTLIVAESLVALVLYRLGRLDSGTSPILDLWDLSKTIAVVALLIGTASRHQSRGLMTVAWVFLVAGLIDAASIHAFIARPIAAVFPFDEWLGLHPLDRVGVAELLVLAVIGVICIWVLFGVKDDTALFRMTRTRFLIIFVGLAAFAGLFDLVAAMGDPHGGWSVAEEVGERTLMTLTLGYVWLISKQDASPQ